jgi:hypothetical protein
MRIPFALLQVQKWQHPVSAGPNPGQQGEHHFAEGQHHAMAKMTCNPAAAEYSSRNEPKNPQTQLQASTHPQVQKKQSTKN